MDTKYHFKIIDGPLLEELFEIDYGSKHMQGFEVVPENEPLRSYPSKNFPERRAISYLIVPDQTTRFFDGEFKGWEGKPLYPSLTDQNNIDLVQDFMKREEKVLGIRGIIHKEWRKTLLPRFDGGTLINYGGQLEIEILYNPDTRKGTMTIKET